MLGKHIVDIQNWPRAEYYKFFGAMDNPYFGITAKVDFTSCYKKAKKDGESYFLYSLHNILQAVNRIPEFRYRIEEGQVVIYDKIGVSPTIGREDGSFGFGFFEYYEDLGEFVEEARKEISRVTLATGLCLGDNEERNDVIYYSSIPWVDFTDLSHAGRMAEVQSIPRISAGKLVLCGDRLCMSVSVELNHGLADGIHVGKFFSILENLNCF